MSDGTSQRSGNDSIWHSLPLRSTFRYIFRGVIVLMLSFAAVAIWMPQMAAWGSFVGPWGNIFVATDSSGGFVMLDWTASSGFLTFDSLRSIDVEAKMILDDVRTEYFGPVARIPERFAALAGLEDCEIALSGYGAALFFSSSYSNSMVYVSRDWVILISITLFWLTDGRRIVRWGRQRREPGGQNWVTM